MGIYRREKERRRKGERKGVYARIKLNPSDTPVEHSFANTRASTTYIAYEGACGRRTQLCLACFALLCLTLPCFALACLALPCLVLSRLVLSWFALFCSAREYSTNFMEISFTIRLLMQISTCTLICFYEIPLYKRFQMKKQYGKTYDFTWFLLSNVTLTTDYVIERIRQCTKYNHL